MPRARLADDYRVRGVRYPGLASDPGHERAAAQMDGFGSLVSFELADAGLADRLTASVTLIVRGPASAALRPRSSAAPGGPGRSACRPG